MEKDIFFPNIGQTQTATPPAEHQTEWDLQFLGKTGPLAAMKTEDSQTGLL
jgi:hypothetical protein